MKAFQFLPVGPLALGVGAVAAGCAAALNYATTGSDESATTMGIVLGVEALLSVWLAAFPTLWIFDWLVVRITSLRKRIENRPEIANLRSPKRKTGLFFRLGVFVGVLSVYSIPLAVCLVVWATLGLLLHAITGYHDLFAWITLLLGAVVFFGLVLLVQLGFLTLTSNAIEALRKNQSKELRTATYIASRPPVKAIDKAATYVSRTQFYHFTTRRRRGTQVVQPMLSPPVSMLWGRRS